MFRIYELLVSPLIWYLVLVNSAHDFVKGMEVGGVDYHLCGEMGCEHRGQFSFSPVSWHPYLSFLLCTHRPGKSPLSLQDKGYFLFSCDEIPDPVYSIYLMYV